MSLGTASPADLRAAHTRLLAAARSVVAGWCVVLVGVCSFVVLALCLVASTALYVHPGYLPVPVMLLAGAVYNVTRFLPRTPDPVSPRVLLAPPDDTMLIRVLTSRTPTWAPASIVLTAEARMGITARGELEVGLPLLSCMRSDHLAVLVEDALARHRTLTAPPVRRAVDIARGQVGRWIGDGGPPASRALVTMLDRRVRRLVVAHADWSEAWASSVPGPTAEARRAVDVVQDAWQHLVETYLVPAVEHGYVHEQPSTGLRELVVAARREGMIDEDVVAATSLAADLGFDRHERYLSPRFDSHDELQHLDWAHHAEAVTLPAWRASVAVGVTAVQRVVGRPLPTTLDTVLGALEGGRADGVAAVVAHTSGVALPDTGAAAGDGDGEESPPARAIVEPLVAAALALTVLERHDAHLRWRWPFGPEVVLGHDVVLHDGAARSAVLEAELGGRCTALRAWLDEVGVDDRAPLWLDGGATPGPDVVIGAFLASRRLFRTGVTVVVSRSAIRIEDQGLGEAMAMGPALRMHGPVEVLRPGMERAAQRLVHGVEVVAVDEVVGADLESILGGMAWRLRVRLPADRVTIYGSVDAQEVAVFLGEALGDRLVTTRVHLPRVVQKARSAWSFIGVSLGGVLVASSVAVPFGDATFVDAVATAGMGVVLVALAAVPDAVHSLGARARTRHRCGEPDTWPPPELGAGWD